MSCVTFSLHHQKMPTLAIFIPAKPQVIEQTRFTIHNEAVTVHKNRAVEDTRTKTFDALIQDSLVGDPARTPQCQRPATDLT